MRDGQVRLRCDPDAARGLGMHRAPADSRGLVERMELQLGRWTLSSARIAATVPLPRPVPVSTRACRTDSGRLRQALTILVTGFDPPPLRNPSGSRSRPGNMDDRVAGLFAPSSLFAICGPCVIESPEHALQIGRAVAAAGRATGVDIVFKASFDKANRTSGDSYRGPGLETGLETLASVRRQTGLPVLTDIHQPDQADRAAETCDVLQVPAFLCRQTDLLVAAGRTGRAVNIKKGQFLAPTDMRHAVDKVAATGNDRVLVTERGSSFGYRNLVVDFRGIAKMRSFGKPVVLDVTHSLQLPGAAGGSSGGQPEYIAPLARAGAACGVDGFFLEVHEAPARALSDGANALRLDLLPPLLEQVAAMRKLVDSWDARGD